ncbi:MAG: hypothetical protein K6G74_01775 [Bacilli bacterium]|nr:hypothetical protein [Bacilli bacterium]
MHFVINPLVIFCFFVPYGHSRSRRRFRRVRHIVICAVRTVVDYLLYEQRGLGDVIDCLDLKHIENGIIDFPKESLFDEFKGNIGSDGNGIICFWKGVDSELNIDYLQFAHFVCVKSEKTTSGEIIYTGYNVNACGYSTIYCGDFNMGWLMNRGGQGWTNDQARKAMISYYVID